MKAGKQASGARYRKTRKKKLFEHSIRQPVAKLGEKKVKNIRVMGGNTKRRLLSDKIVNITDKSGKTSKVEIKNVFETPSNRFLARQNILTKGALIETKIGKARITNRPAQEGNIQAIIVDIE